MAKWIIGAVLLGFIGYLLITYVPGVKFWQKEREKDTTTWNQLQAEKAARAKSEKEFADYKAKIETDADKIRAQLNSLLPSLQLQIKQMSQQTRKQAILASLYNQRLLSARDTVALQGAGPTEFTPNQQEAIGTKIGICDSLQHKFTNVLNERTAAVDLAVKRKDSLARWNAWSERGKWLAELKGIATGRNKKLRQYTVDGPYLYESATKPIR